MNAYVTKKESIRLFKTDGEEPGGKGFVRGRKRQKSGKTSCETISTLLREFRGDIVSSDKMILYSFEN